MIKAVLFDIDGTLIDSFHQNWNSYKKAFALAGIADFPSEELYLTSYHLPLRESFAHLAEDKSVENIDKLFNIFINMDYDDDNRYILMPHVEETLQELQGKYKLGIVTGRQQLSVAEFLQECNLERYFDSVVHHGIYKHPKPNPEPLTIAMNELEVQPNETVYIGDTWADIEASQAAGVNSILYHYQATGNHTLTGADAIIKSYLELPEILNKLATSQLV